VAVSSTESEESLAVWAFEAAINGLPEAEARRLLEGDRYPEPERGSWESAVESVRVEDDGLVLYDPDTATAWIQSDTAVDLSDWC